MPIDYSKCKVYKLCADSDANEYIGSTCEPLCKRMSGHRSAAKNAKKQGNVYAWMRDVGIDKVIIVLISEHPECKNFDQQRMIERDAIARLKPSLNMLAPYRKFNNQEWPEYAANVQPHDDEMDVFFAKHFASDKNVTNRISVFKKLLNHAGSMDAIRAWSADDLVKACRELWNKNEGTFCTALGSAKKTMEALTDRPFDVYQEMMTASRATAAKRAENKPTAKMLANPEVTWQALMDLEKKLREAEYASEAHALLAVRVMAWPRRNGDLQQVVVAADESDAANTICLNPMRITYNHHKNAAKSGPFVLRFDDNQVCNVADLEPILTKYIETKQTGDVLFANVAKTWDTIMIKHFGVRDFGIQEVRRLASEYIHDAGYTAAQKMAIADCMGHNVQQQGLYDVSRPADKSTVDVAVQTDACTDETCAAGASQEATLEQCVTLLEDLHGDVADHDARIVALERLVLKLMAKM